MAGVKSQYQTKSILVKTCFINFGPPGCTSMKNLLCCVSFSPLDSLLVVVITRIPLIALEHRKTLMIPIKRSKKGKTITVRKFYDQ